MSCEHCMPSFEKASPRRCGDRVTSWPTSMSLAILVTLSTGSAAASGYGDASNWTQDLLTHIELCEEQGKRWALVEIQVDSVSSGALDRSAPVWSSEVIVRVLKIHAGTLDDSPRMFVDCGFAQDPIHGSVVWGVFTGRAAQQWLQPADHVLALVWRPSDERLRAGDRVGDWWASGPWWRVQLAAHIEGEELRVVTQVANSKLVEQPDWGGSRGHPNRRFPLMSDRTWSDVRPWLSVVLHEVEELQAHHDTPE